MSINIRSYQWNQGIGNLGFCPICQEDLLLEDSIHPAAITSLAPIAYDSSSIHPATISASLPSFQGHDVSSSTGERIYHLMHQECAAGFLATSRKCSICHQEITHIEGAQAPELGYQGLTLQQQLLNTQTIEIIEAQAAGAALIRAVKSQNLELTTQLLGIPGINLNVRDEDGFTSLMLAVWSDNLEITQVLIAAEADLNIQLEQSDKTALMLAISGGSTTITEALINAGADLNLQDSHGTTALMIAACENQSVIVQTLITARADFSLQNLDGQSALDLATTLETKTLILDAMRLQALKESDLGSELEGTDLVLELINEYSSNE